MRYSIRNASIGDAAAIARLSGQLGYTADQRLIEERLAEILRSDSSCVFVVLESEKPIGWIHGFYSLRVESEAFVEIGGLVVDTQHRKSGVGKLLVDEVVRWCELRKHHKLRVRCNSIRTEAHAFYERIGFELDKEQKVFDRRLQP